MKRLHQAIYLAMLLGLSVGCSPGGPQDGSRHSSATIGSAGNASKGEEPEETFSEEPLTVSLKSIEGKEFVELDTLLSELGVNAEWNDEARTLDMGYIDPSFEAAEADYRDIDGKRYIAKEALLTFLADENMAVKEESGSITISKGAETLALTMASGNPSFSLANIDTKALLEYAKQFIGTPYKFGAKPSEWPAKMDCSAFVAHVYKKFGVKLPRASYNQATKGRAVPLNSLMPGDVVFFTVPGRFKDPNKIGHVGIYLGNGQIIHTYTTKKPLGIEPLAGKWQKRLVAARRFADNPNGGGAVDGGSSAPATGGIANVYRFFNGKDHYATRKVKGPSSGGYHYENVSFRVYTADRGSERKGIYSCYITAWRDQFVSREPNCEGHKKLGFLGYLGDVPAGQPVYRCLKDQNHLTTTNPEECQHFGYAVEGILGYAP